MNDEGEAKERRRKKRSRFGGVAGGGVGGGLVSYFRSWLDFIVSAYAHLESANHNARIIRKAELNTFVRPQSRDRGSANSSDFAVNFAPLPVSGG
jgi:hypothetical protein